MENVTVEYRFTLSSGFVDVFVLTFDRSSMDLLNCMPETLPFWTELGFHQCPHCPLTVDQHPHCPVAANLVAIVSRCDKLMSYDTLYLEVITGERIVSQETTAQRAIRSLMGLVIGTSNCPRTAFFKPMARFHLPLATEAETIFRAASTYLLAQYFREKNDGSVDLDLEGLVQLYKNIELVNRTVAKRIREVTATDSSINAIIQLDMFAKTMPIVIRESLDEMRSLFNSFLESERQDPLPDI